MKIIYEQEEANTLQFSDVQDSQFFVDIDGDLCQKINSNSYNTIAYRNGEPYAATIDCACNSKKIKRILPKVTKIEF